MPACSSRAAERDRRTICPHSPKPSRGGPIAPPAPPRASRHWQPCAMASAPPRAPWPSLNPCSACLTTSRGERGRRCPRRAMEEEPLNQVDAKLLHGLELLRPLHAFGDHHRAVIVRELHHRLHEILLDEVRIDAIDERDVELDVVRLEI